MRWWLFCLAWGSARLAAWSAQAEDLSLETVVKVALTRNERAEIAAQSVVAADAAVTKARVAFLPTLNMTAGETLRPQQIDQNGKVVARDNAANAALTLTQSLFNASAFPLYAS